MRMRAFEARASLLAFNLVSVSLFEIDGVRKLSPIFQIKRVIENCFPIVQPKNRPCANENAPTRKSRGVFVLL